MSVCYLHCIQITPYACLMESYNLSDTNPYMEIHTRQFKIFVAEFDSFEYGCVLPSQFLPLFQKLALKLVLNLYIEMFFIALN
jgi:hypothetical protein